MSLDSRLTQNLSPQRILIATCCGLLATGAFYVTQQQAPLQASQDPSALVLPALAASSTAVSVPAAALPAVAQAGGPDALSVGGARTVRRVVVTHDRPGRIVFSWDGPDLKVEIVDAVLPKSARGASAL
jgi:hypothetical protein